MNDPKAIRRLSLFLAALVLLSFVPLLALAPYARPGMDDYWHGARAHAVWTETRSVGATVLEALRGAREIWFTWQGTYTDMFLSMIHPGVFSESLYWISPVMTLLIFSLSILYLFRVVLGDLLGLDRDRVRAVTSVFLLLCLWLLPDGAQGFYWHAGTCAYMWMLGLSFVSGALIVRGIRTGRIRYTFLSAMTSFLAAGGNYSTALVHLLLLLLACVFCLRKKIRAAALYVSVLAFVAGFALCLLAPGNWVRISGEPGIPLPIAVFHALLDTIKLLSEWTTVPFLLFEAAACALLLPVARRLPFSYTRPWIGWAGAYLLVAAGLSTFVYGYGETSSWVGRLFDVLFILYAALFLICLFWTWAHLASVFSSGPDKASARKPLILAAGLLAVTLFFGYGTYRYRPERYYDVTVAHIPPVSAAISLLNGDARGFAEEMDARLPVLYDDSVRDVVLNPLSHRPYLLFITDVQTNPDHFYSTFWAKFYGKDSVRLLHE